MLWNLLRLSIILKKLKKKTAIKKKIDYAQTIAKKTVSAPNLESASFVDSYSQTYLDAYDNKKNKIKNFNKIKNAVLGSFALIGGFILIVICSKLK